MSLSVSQHADDDSPTTSTPTFPPFTHGETSAILRPFRDAEVQSHNQYHASGESMPYDPYLRPCVRMNPVDRTVTVERFVTCDPIEESEFDKEHYPLPHPAKEYPTLKTFHPASTHNLFWCLNGQDDADDDEKSIDHVHNSQHMKSETRKINSHVWNNGNKYADREEIFKKVGLPAVNRVLNEKKDACVCACGHSASGKTHVLFGNMDVTDTTSYYGRGGGNRQNNTIDNLIPGEGLILRCARKILDRIDSETTTIEMSFLMLHNQKCNDLFAEMDEDKNTNRTSNGGQQQQPEEKKERDSGYRDLKCKPISSSSWYSNSNCEEKLGIPSLRDEHHVQNLTYKKFTNMEQVYFFIRYAFQRRLRHITTMSSSSGRIPIFVEFRISSSSSSTSPSSYNILRFFDALPPTPPELIPIPWQRRNFSSLVTNCFATCAHFVLKGEKKQREQEQQKTTNLPSASSRRRAAATATYHVPIRNSAASRILKGVFFKTEKLFYIACLSPHPDDFGHNLAALELGETISQLEYV